MYDSVLFLFSLYPVSIAVGQLYKNDDNTQLITNYHFFKKCISDSSYL